MNVLFSRISRGVLGLVALASVAVAYVPSAQACGPIACDTDTLDLSGDWILTYGYAPGLIVDSAGHYAPYDMVAGFCPCGVHFDAIGPNAHGGTSYKGYYKPTLPGVTSGWRGTFYADTLYDARGVQVVQMFWQYAPDEDYAVWAGKHEIYSNEPTRVEVDGGYAYMGGQLGNFVLVKYRT